MFLGVELTVSLMVPKLSLFYVAVCEIKPLQMSCYIKFHYKRINSNQTMFQNSSPKATKTHSPLEPKPLSMFSALYKGAIDSVKLSVDREDSGRVVKSRLIHVMWLFR